MEQVLERAQTRPGRRQTDAAKAPRSRRAPAVATPPEPKVMHRKGSQKGRITNPTNLEERLIARRQELDMSQNEVAEKIKFWNNKQKASKTLSRSAYCMYESGEVTPDVHKLELLAKVLKCEVGWLAFGIGDTPRATDNLVEQVDWDAATHEFVPKQSWSFDAEWATTRFDAPPADLAIASVNDFSPNLKPGDLAVVRRGIEPTSAGGEFVFVQDDEMKVAHVTRPSAGGAYRIYDADRRTHAEATADDLTFLGKVVGRIGDV